MKRKIWKYLLAACLVTFLGNAHAQELKCQVEVNSQQVEGTNKNVFEALRESMSTYMNETKFSSFNFSPIEKLDCRLFLTVSEYVNDRVKAA